MQFWPVLVGAASFCCAHYSQKDGERLANDVYGMETKVQALEKITAENQKLQKTLTELVDTLQAQVQVLNKTAFKNDADFGAQLDQALLEISRLRGLVEDSKERLDTMESQLNKIGDEFGMAEESRKQAELSAKESKQAAEDAQRRERIVQNVDLLKSEVERLMADKRPADARKLLREYIKQAETNDRLKKSLDLVQFLLAETYFAEANYQLAATEYNLVRKNYAKSPKIADALFRMGQCFENLKLIDDAKLFYKTAVEKYPKSDAANRARARLKELK